MDFLTFNLAGNSIKEYLIALGVFIIVFLILRFFRTVGINKLKKLTQKTKNDFDSSLVAVIESVGFLFYLIFPLYLASRFIVLSNLADKIIYYLFLAVLAYYLIKVVTSFIDYGSQKVIEKRKGGEFDPHLVKIATKIIKVIVWLVAVILILQNLGYNISTLVAGLGIGGIAIAFAIQNILGDIFASFSIYFDRPFEIGDFIIIGKDMGVVKKIGIKSTRLQTLQGEELVISNKELTSSRINNYKKMKKRRIVFSFGIAYETPNEKIKKVSEIVSDVIKEINFADLDRVHFKKFGDFSLEFEVVYYLNSSDYNVYMDIQERINLALKEKFEKEDIVFAYPTQTVYLQRS